MREPYGAFLARLRQAQNASSKWREHDRERRELAEVEPVQKPHGAGGSPIKVDAGALAERDRCMAAQHSTIVGRLAGDPLPGRSALDKRKPRLVRT